MKTLNLNKIILLTALFLAAIVFSNSANALCVVNGAGAIVIAADSDGNSETPVKDDTTTDDYTANTATTDCLITPDIYKLNIYKFGLCTADPDLNDLTSCQMFFEETAGVVVDIELLLLIQMETQKLQLKMILQLMTIQLILQQLIA